MKVYVLESADICGSPRYDICGVYATLELAQGAAGGDCRQFADTMWERADGDMIITAYDVVVA